MSLLTRRLRGLVRTALLWSLGWGAAAVVLLHAMRLVGEVPPNIGFLDILGMAFRVAVWGGVVGTLFSALIGLAFRGRRLADLRTPTFAAVGALTGGVGIPGALLLINRLAGDGTLSWRVLQDDAVLGTVLGGALAGGSLWMAQRAERRALASTAPVPALDGATAGPPHAFAATPVTDRRFSESAPVCDPHA
ncbi:MAG TPA: hypothetical protein PKE51_06365 [Gemmatimonadaceae bacterium]|nr:hypothetical protein [Gemmatimonadaceae bacterium]